MPVIELRDPKEARRFVAQGLWLQRATQPRPAPVEKVLEWSLEIASEGELMPPVGLVADVGHLLLEPRWSVFDIRTATVEVPGWPSGLARAYEDVVLGKLDCDSTFAMASEALARYRGRDFGRGLAFVLERIRSRSRVGGVIINPVALKPDPNRTSDQILLEGWESLERDGPMPVLLDLYAEWVKLSRDLANALGPEDVFELKHGTALASFGQRLALRQVLQVVAEFEAEVPVEPPRRSGRRNEVSTRFLDEDAYPVGGFSSISTRGSIESLLHSQLVYMEPGERPDPFDIKFVRDELLYYARDENQFFRRRRTFIFALYNDLAGARVKDPGLPRQRIVLVLGLIVAAIRRLSAWLGGDSLAFEVVFVDSDRGAPLDLERELLELILGDEIDRGDLKISRMSVPSLATLAESRGQRSLCHVLTVSTAGTTLKPDSAIVSEFVAHGPIPGLVLGGDLIDCEEESGPREIWRSSLSRLLEFWI